MIDQLEIIERDARAALSAVNTLDDLTAWRQQWTGKKSTLTTLSQQIGKLSAEERPIFGQRFGALKTALTEAETIMEQRLGSEALHRELEEDAVDVTLPGRPIPVGRLHPST